MRILTGEVPVFSIQLVCAVKMPISFFVFIPQEKNVELHVPQSSSRVQTAAAWIWDWSVTPPHNVVTTQMRKNARNVSR